MKAERGISNIEIQRCLKRYIVRELYPLILADLSGAATVTWHRSVNAPIESLWGSLKVGRLYGIRFETRRQAMDEVIDWLNYYNYRRLFDTGIHQSNEVRAKLARGTIEKDRIISAFRCTDYRGKVNYSWFSAKISLHHWCSLYFKNILFSDWIKFREKNNHRHNYSSITYSYKSTY